MLNQAIERTIDPPGWYYHFIAIDLYRSGEYDQMLSVAERAAKDGSGFGQALIAIASGALEEPESARMALERMSHDTSLASDPAAYFRTHGATEELVEMLLDGLTQARRVATGDFTKLSSY
jgi:hypothetical protein